MAAQLTLKRRRDEMLVKIACERYFPGYVKSDSRFRRDLGAANAALEARIRVRTDQDQGGIVAGEAT